MSLTTFDQIQVGKTFKAPTGITYLKSSNEQARPHKKTDGTLIHDGKVTTSFYKSKIQLESL
jgi:hypothetical protein